LASIAASTLPFRSRNFSIDRVFRAMVVSFPI
jgi:hypothetical protein